MAVKITFAHGTQSMAIISFPKNFFLKIWIFWIIVECTLKIAYELDSNHEFQQIRDVLHGFILPWFCGALWSDFKWLSYAVIAVHIYIVLVVLLRIESLIPNIKIWIVILFLLAMFTLWVEPWITIFTHKSPEALLAFTSLAGILFMIDLTFSGLWFVLTWAIWELLDQEF